MQGAREEPRMGPRSVQTANDRPEDAPARSLRPRRAPSSTTTDPSPTAITRRAPLPRPTGRILIVHANGKEYGRGAAGPKASNRDFSFDAKDYVAMRDSGQAYSGNPRRNKLLPLPRPTYTEFINRARSARMPERPRGTVEVRPDICGASLA